MSTQKYDTKSSEAFESAMDVDNLKSYNNIIVSDSYNIEDAMNNINNNILKSLENDINLGNVKTKENLCSLYINENELEMPTPEKEVQKIRVVNFTKKKTMDNSNTQSNSMLKETKGSRLSKCDNNIFSKTDRNFGHNKFNLTNTDISKLTKNQSNLSFRKIKEDEREKLRNDILSSELEQEREKQSHLNNNDKKQINYFYNKIIEKDISPEKDLHIEDYNEKRTDEKTNPHSILAIKVQSTNLELFSVIEENPELIFTTFKEETTKKDNDRPMKKIIAKKEKPKSKPKLKPKIDIKYANQSQQEIYELRKKIKSNKLSKNEKKKKEKEEPLKIKKQIDFNVTKKYFTKKEILQNEILSFPVFSQHNKLNITDIKLVTEGTDFDEKINELAFIPNSHMKDILTYKSTSNSPSKFNQNTEQKDETRIIVIEENEEEIKSIDKSQTKKTNITSYFNRSKVSRSRISSAEKAIQSLNEHYEKYNIQTLGYDTYRNYSQARIDPNAPFLDRMAFSSVKFNHKNDNINKLVNEKIPKVPESNQVLLVNKLIDDTNRREIAKANVTFALEKIEEAYISKLSSSKKKITTEEWNNYYEKNIKEKQQQVDFIKQQKEQEKITAMKLKETAEIEEITKRNKKVTKAKADEIFKRINSTTNFQLQSKRKDKSYNSTNFNTNQQNKVMIKHNTQRNNFNSIKQKLANDINNESNKQDIFSDRQTVSNNINTDKQIDTVQVSNIPNKPISSLNFNSEEGKVTNMKSHNIINGYLSNAKLSKKITKSSNNELSKSKNSLVNKNISNLYDKNQIDQGKNYMKSSKYIYYIN